MSDEERIRSAFERIATAIARRPSLGRSTGISKTRVVGGLRCETHEGPWHLATDMSEPAGGQGSAPTPGVLGRAALGSCLAMGYTMYAAKLGVPIAELEVEVQADYDDGALFGVTDSPAGYLEVRYIVTIKSDAPEADIWRVLDESDAHDPYLDVFSRAQSCRREVRISSVGEHA